MANGFPALLRPLASCLTPGRAHGSSAHKIKSAFLTNRKRHIGKWLLPQAQSTAFDGLHHSDWFGGCILHYGLVLSAAKEVLDDGFGWGSVVEDVHSAVRRGWPMGRLRLSKNDFVIIIANAVGLALLMGILYFKLRDRASPA
jgi:hypothetical protein